MAKLSMARVPYYVAVAVFCGFSAIAASFMNDDATGIESDFYLILTAAFGLLAAWAVYYLFTVQHGSGDEVGVEVAGLPAGKNVFYLGVLGTAAYRAFVGYQMNHNLTGIDSFYGKVWLLAALVIALFTWSNYRSFQAKFAAPHHRTARG